MSAEYMTHAFCRHGRMIFNSNDTYVGGSLRAMGEFSELEWQIMAQFITSESVCLDIGANIGALTLPMAAKAKCVLAFEPQPHAYWTLCGNLALNDVNNVYPARNAVGEKPGRILVPVLDQTTPNNFGGLPIGGSKGMNTGVIAIDAMDIARVDFMKIDVEGMESEVLMGAANTIKKHRPVVIYEEDRDKSREYCERFFTVLNYDLKHLEIPLWNTDNFFGTKEIPPALIRDGHLVMSYNALATPR